MRFLVYIILIAALSSCNFVGKARYGKFSKKKDSYEVILGKKIKKEGRQIDQGERKKLNASLFKQINIVSNKIIPAEAIAKYDLLNLSPGVNESKYCATSSLSSFFRKSSISYSNYKYIINELNKDLSSRELLTKEDNANYLLKQVDARIDNLTALASKLKNKQMLNDMDKIASLKVKSDHFTKTSSKEKLLHKKLSILASIDEVIERIPLYHPIAKAKMMSGYGERIHPKSGKKHKHSGIDLSGEDKSDIVAAAKGVVKAVKHGRQYGYYVIIDHGNKFQTLYAHMVYPLKVKLGQKIEAGDIIGYQGSTGNSTGPHLHFEIRKDNFPINPTEYVSFAAECLNHRNR